MTKVVKSISLDEKTAPIAASKDNFSKWVREQLLAEIAYSIPCHFFERQREVGSRLVAVEGEICNGVRSPPCGSCYPDGPPLRADWIEYVRFKIDLEELLERTAKEWKWRTDLKEQVKESEKEASTPPLKGQKKYVRRLLKWIWAYI